MVKALIIDDDHFIVDLLKDKIDLYVPKVEIIGAAYTGQEGIDKIGALQPNLIFLDVEMSDMTGFEMLSQLETIQFQTIFITSFRHYAIKAIRFNALDYLVKPIDLGELKASIVRFEERSRHVNGIDKVKTALTNLKTKDLGDQVLVLKTQEGEMRLSIKHIVRIEGERNYSYIYLTNEKKKLTTKTLGDLEELLADKGFFRPHKSFLVNRMHIDSVPNSFQLVLSDGSEVPIARRKKAEFKAWYGQ
jgi:two-component system LytT family response regulator